MRTTLVALALTAGLATGGAALVVPTSAFAQDSATSTATVTPDAGTAERVAARVSALKTALAGLVTDGTLTQAQADEVATTLSTSDALRGGGRGHGHHGVRGGHLSHEAVASVLGITTEELRTLRQAGKTLAQIAQAEGISRSDLISRLVAAAKEQLAADVTAGRITQAQADAKAATLTADVTARVDQVKTGRGGRRGAPDAAATTAPGA